MKLQDKVAIVTAGGRGIGRGIALCLAEEGANVVVNSFHEETTSNVAAEIKAMGRQSLGIPGDITKPEMIARVIQSTLDTFGRIDILVNNVGGQSRLKPTGPGLFEQLIADWDGTYDQNLRAIVLMCKAVAPHFTEQNSGKIVNISSLSARYDSRFARVSYGSMKTALIRFSQSLANELGPHNINVNCICPGFVYTDMAAAGFKRYVESKPEYKGMDPREFFLEFMKGKHPELGPLTPLQREQTAEDIGRAVVFFVSEDARNITGQTLNVDGGRIKN
jgi:NAD(P)-dependent dehydrogenase (short-subunit alcohol dehydrogenase family)